MSATPRFRLLVFGGLQLQRMAGGLPPQIQRKRLALLVTLAVAGNKGESRDRLAALLWPESDAERARQSLKQAVYALRQILGDDAIVTDRAIVKLDERFVASDVEEFARASTMGSEAVRADLYAGPFLDGWHLSDSEDLERWIEERRSYFAARAQAAIRAMATAAADRGDSGQSVAMHSRLVRMDPLATPNTLALMAALVRAGDTVGAIREGEQFQERLDCELGLQDSSVAARLESLRAEVLREGARTQAVVPEAASLGESAPEPARPKFLPIAEERSSESRTWGARRMRRRGAFAAALAVGGLMFAVVMVGRGLRPKVDSVENVLTVRVRDEHGHPWPEAITLVSETLAEARQVVVWSESDKDQRSLTWRTRPCGKTPALLVDGQAHRDSPHISVDLREACAGGRVIAHFDTTAQPGETFLMLRRTALELAASLGDAQSRRIARAALATSTSPTAAVAFLRGQTEFRRARYDSAVNAFSRAATTDTAFAFAQYWLSVSADWAGRPLIVESAARRAMVLRRQLPARDRMLAEGWFAMKFGRASDAESIYTSVANSYPDDVEAWLQLGEVLFHGNSVRGRAVQDAVGPFQRALALDSVNEPVLHHLVQLAAMRADTLALDALSDRVERLHLPSESLELSAFRAFASGDSQRQRAMVDRLSKRDPVTVGTATWRIAAFARNVDAATALANSLVANPAAAAHRQFAYDKLAEFAVAQGKWGLADVALSKAAATDPDATLEYRALLTLIPPIIHPESVLISIQMRLRWLADSSSGKTETHTPVRLYLIGLLADRLHDVRTVDAMAVRLRALTDAARYADPALARSYALGLEGLSARRRGHVQLAISRLQSVPFDQFPEYRAGPLGSQTYERLALADLLSANGRSSEAIAWLRAIGDGLETSWYPAAHLRLAEIAESRGDVPTARREYDAFCAEWEHAEPSGRPILDEARRRRKVLDRFAVSGGTVTGSRVDTAP